MMKSGKDVLDSLHGIQIALVWIRPNYFILIVHWQQQQVQRTVPDEFTSSAGVQAIEDDIKGTLEQTKDLLKDHPHMLEAFQKALSFVRDAIIQQCTHDINRIWRDHTCHRWRTRLIRWSLHGRISCNLWMICRTHSKTWNHWLVKYNHETNCRM